jgi:Ligated ion channel L-glutamate- and glycine-binding site
MLRKSGKATGNDMYEGYCADLARKLSENINNFNYRLKVVADNAYGAEQKDGSWNGMIGELQRGVSIGQCSIFRQPTIRERKCTTLVTYSINMILILQS